MFTRSFLIGLVCGLWALYGVVAAWESPGNRELILYLTRLWRQRTLFGKFVVVVVVGALAAFAVIKPEKQGTALSLEDTGLSHGISIEDAPMSAETPTLTSSMMVNGYALTQITAGTVSWLSYPENHMVLSNWLVYGVHDDVQHFPANPQFDIYYSTNIASHLFCSSSGTLSFDTVKSTPFASTNGLPDGSHIPYAAVLHGPLSAIPPASKAWHSTSPTNFCMTWENFYAGRDTNNPVSFQMEVLANQDIVYRYLLSSNCVNSQVLTNFLVGLQANAPDGGESLRFNATNATPQNFELYWTYFGYLDPAFDHHDEDTLTSSYEVYVSRTNPHVPDTDFDGLWDDAEVAAGSDPNCRDTDGDGLVDGSDPNPTSADTADVDADGILDAWELFFFGTLDALSDLSADFSTSGASDGIAMLTGIDPVFSVCVVTTSHGEHRLSWTDLADATNYTAIITCGSTTKWICSTNICSLAVTGDFTAAQHTLTVTAHCASNRLTRTASQTFRQPTEPNLTVWKITDPIVLESSAGDTTVLERSFNIGRVREWQQYYITADYQSAAGWELDGMDLHWSDTTGAEGSTNASPQNSLLLESGADAQTLTVQLSTTRAGLVKSTQPLYLIEWSPAVTIDASAALFDDGDGMTMVLISERNNTPTDTGFTVNTLGRPSNIALTADQRELLNDPFGDSGSSFSRRVDATGLISGGAFDAGESGCTTVTAPGGAATGAGVDGGEGGAVQDHPGAAGQGAFTLLRIAPTILDINGGAGGQLECVVPGSDQYPFDTACLRKRLLYAYHYPTNDYQGGNDAGGVEVSLGLTQEEEQRFTITINTVEGATYSWREADQRASVTVDFGTNQVWSGSRERLDMTERDGGYWGDGPPVDLTVEDDACGCDDGCASGDCSDNDGPDLGSLKFRLSLGQSGCQQSGGFLWFKTDAMPEAITPDLVIVSALPSINVTSNNNALSCVDNAAVNGRRIDVSTITGGVRFDIYRYDRSHSAVLEGGWEITKSGSSVTFIGKDSSNNTLRNLTYSYDNTVQGWNDLWTETDNLTGRVLVKSEVFNGGTTTKRIDTLDTADNLFHSVENSVATIGIGTAAVERVFERSEYGKYGQWESKTTYSYHTDNLNPRVNGKLKLQRNDDTSWEYYLWDESGRETLRVTSAVGCALPAYLDSAPDFSFNPGGSYLDLNAEISQYAYTTHAGDSNNWHDAAKPRTVTRYRVCNGTPVPIARTWHKYLRGTTNILGETYSIITHTAIRAANQSAAINDAANKISVETSFLDSYCGSLHLDGRPLFQQSEDGTTTTCEHDFDTYKENDVLVAVAFTGSAATPQGLSGKSTYEVETTDLYYGHTLSRATWLYIDGANDVPLATEWNDHDAKGRLISTEYSDGTVMINEWDCCHLLQSIDRSGIITQYPMETNWLHSETLVISPGLLPGAAGRYPVSGSYVDLLGRTTNSYSAGQSTITVYPEYFSHLRVTTDPQGIVTTNRTSMVLDEATQKYQTVEETTRAGVKTTTRRLANGEPVTATEWTDSVSGEHLKRMTKTASETQPNGWEKRTSYVKYDDGNWIAQSEIVTDFLGRSVSVTTPLGTTSNFYDAATGRLVKVSRTGMADTLYGYNELGERIVTCLNVNGNETIDFEGLDRINRIDRIFELRSNDWWQVTYSELWAETNAVASITGSVTRVRMTGLGVDTYNGAILTAQSESEDELKNVTRTSTYTDAANVTTWQVTDTPESNIDAVQKSVAGYPVLSISSTSITNSYTYDGFARIVETTEGTEDHRVKSVTAYNDFGQVAYVENAATNRNSFVYNGLGQRVASSNALGQVSYTTYNGVGNVIATWGTSYPVAYEIDTAGRMIALATTRSNDYANVNLNSLVPLGETLSSLSLQPSSLDITRWFYDDVTGLLTNKLYADGNGTAYTYTDEGRLATRTWARGVTANYSYSTSGQLTGITYNDNTTPNVNFTYDRLGRMISATSASSTRTFEYTGLALTKETQDGYIIERIYDKRGRTIGYELYSQDDLINPVQTIIYDYSESGFFKSVQSVKSAETNLFTYSHLPGTDLISGYTGTASTNPQSQIQIQKSFEANRNLITAITNSVPSVVSSFNYENNALGQRTKRADYFNASTINNGFIYNIFGEVTGAIMNDDNYTYINDPIGNRVHSIVDSGQSSVTNRYTSNNLNQYTSVYSVSSVVNPTFDSDGNMDWNGRNALSYDAENRLLSAAPSFDSTTNGATRTDYTYDYMNRRISKSVSVMSGRYISNPPLRDDPQGAWSALETRKYIYDGWNLVAEIIIDQTEFTTNMNSYTWGLDLSGTLQGAGGVGGLLCETKNTSSSTNTYYVFSDTNGNITEYVDDTGTVKAHIEYSVTGEETYKSGTMKDDFCFRFSTKYYDPETGFYYYGHRYYDVILMRWLSRDSIGERGGPGLYVFVLNSSMDNIDSLGLINVRPFIDELKNKVENAADYTKAKYGTMKLYTVGVWDNAVFFKDWSTNAGEDERTYGEGDRLVELFKRSHGIKSARQAYKAAHCPEPFRESYASLQGYKDVFFDLGFVNASEWQIGGFQYEIKKLSGNEVEFIIENYASWRSLLAEPTLRNWASMIVNDPWEPWPLHTRDDVWSGGVIKQTFRWKEKSPCCGGPSLWFM